MGRRQPDADAIAQLERVSRLLGEATHYELLQVSSGASRAEIRRAYFALSKRLHPDNFFGVDLGSRRGQLEQAFAALTQAYETLCREPVRRMYDASLGLPTGEGPGRVAAASTTAENDPQTPLQVLPDGKPAARARGGRRAAPAALSLRKLADRVRAREAQAAEPSKSHATERANGKEIASALARQLAGQASREELLRRAHLRAAEQAEARGQLDVAYRELCAAQRLAAGDVSLLRRTEDVHRRWMVQEIPANRELALQAERRGTYKEAGLYWARVAEASDALDAHMAAARAFLRDADPAGRAKAGRHARRAVELSPDQLRVRQLMLDFFEQAGMARNAAREREVVQQLKQQRQEGKG